MLQKVGKEDESTARDEATERGKPPALRETTGLSSDSSWAITPWSKQVTSPSLSLRFFIYKMICLDQKPPRVLFCSTNLRFYYDRKQYLDAFIQTANTLA